MTAVEGDRDWPMAQQLVEGDQVSGIVGQDEGRHRIIRSRDGLADTVLPNSLHQPIDRLGKAGRSLPGGVCKRPQLLTERDIHLAHALECGIEIGRVRAWRHEKGPTNSVANDIRRCMPLEGTPIPGGGAPPWHAGSASTAGEAELVAGTGSLGGCQEWLWVTL